MRIFISADIAGVAGIASSGEAKKGHPGYERFRAQMDAEVDAACAGAFSAGAGDEVVKDAPRGRPQPRSGGAAGSGVADPRLQRPSPGDRAASRRDVRRRHVRRLPQCAGSGGNPLSHTMSSSKLFLVRLDGEPVSESRLHALAAGTLGVALVTGDRALCEEVGVTVAGGTTVESALRGPLPDPLVPRPPHRLEVVDRDPAASFVRAFYPGAHRVDDYFEILRALVFLAGIG